MVCEPPPLFAALQDSVRVCDCGRTFDSVHPCVSPRACSGSVQASVRVVRAAEGLRKFDPNAGRWDVDVRDAGAKRLKEENLRKPTPLVVQAGLT
eukprot:1214256-Amphidinium_carterae.2